MLILLFGSIIGIITGLFIDFNLYIALCFLLIILYTFFKYKKILKNVDIGKFVCFLLCTLFFFIYTNTQIIKYDTKYLDGNINEKYKIISYADEGEYYYRYICKNMNGDKFLIYFQNKNELKKGDIVNVRGEFILPNLVRNTGSFNYRRYLNSQKIYGSIFVSNYFLEDIPDFNLIYFIQDEIYKSFKKLFPKNEMGLVIGMMIGETKDISDDVLKSFKDTGITHLIAVSGTNVMYILILVQIIFNKICGKRKTYFISIFFIIVFMFISGASSSVVRATIMSSITILANIFYRKSDVINNISISAFILMLINPLIIYDIGFILSFGGTLGIVFFSKDLKKVFKKFGKFSETLAVTCSAQMFLIPIMAYYFNSFSTIAIFTNLIVVPISGFITILGFFVFIISKIYFPLAVLLSRTLYVLVYFTILVSNSFSKIPFSNIKIITPNIFEIILYYFSIFFLMGLIPINRLIKEKSRNIGRFINKEKKRDIIKYRIKILLCIFIVFCIFEFVFYGFPKSFVEVDFIDVGQGDATFIKSNYNKNIMIDGGGSKTHDIGEKVLIPYLLDKRVLHINAIFSSHSDDDHLNGIISVVSKMKVDKIFIAKGAQGYEKLYDVLDNKNTKIIELQVGDIIKIDDLIFEVLGPAQNVDNKDVNAYSLVLKMKYFNKSILFTGDISKESELKLQNVKADVLKVAHHGSNTSSSIKFISKVNPSISVIQVGQKNKFGHPNKEVLNILKKYSKIYTTANMGEIKMKIYNDKINIE